MTTITNIIAIAMATYLLTTYLVYENGPHNFFAALRFFAGINQPVFDMDEQPTGEFVSNGSFLANMLLCHRCTGLWVGAVMVLLSVVLPVFVWVIGSIGLGVFFMDLTYGAVTDEQ